MIFKEALFKAEQILNKSKIPTPGLDSEVLFSFAIGRTKEFIYTYPEKEISNKELKYFFSLINKRANYFPVAYITGQREFYGMNFQVNKNVLVPCPETELLVEEVIDYCSKRKGNDLTIADIGTGSGIIALTLKKYLPNSKILATDKSKKALKIARINGRKLKLKISYYSGNLLEPIKLKKIDIIVANMPYVDSKGKNYHRSSNLSVHKKILSKMPSISLFGGKYGLEIYEKFFKQIVKLKYSPEAIFCEIGHSYLVQTKKLVNNIFPKSQFEIKKDLAGLNRILIIRQKK